MNIYDRLSELNITLPPVATPAAAYVPFVQTGNLVFLSGHIAKKDGKAWVGQLGLNMTTDEAKLAARAVAIDLLGNSTSTFTEQHLVTNGCSALIGEIFGDKGAHARSAFGVTQLPMGSCVEIELIAEVA
jgi:enamine deaminase RidA (YjgF/YER057c/UK114 family)